MEKEVNIKIEGKEWEKAIEVSLEKALKNTKIDGFRKGHVPKDIFLKKYGKESLYADAVEEVLDKAYTKALEENKDIQLVAQPQVSIKNVDEKHVEFVFTLTTKPEVKLGKYTNLGVEKEKVTVTKEEIDHEIEHMRSHYAESVIKEGAIESGDEAIIDFEGFKDGVPFEGGKAENYSLKIGSNSFIPGFEDQLIGMNAGETKEIEVTFPEDYHAEDLKGKKATFKVTVHEIKTTVIPEINEEFFEDLGMEGINTLESLEKQVEENIKAQKEANAENKYIDELLDKASEGVEVNIPHVMIDEEVERMLEQYKQQLSMQGISIEQFYQFTNSNEQALKEQMHKEAEKRVKLRLMLEEIAKQEKIEIKEEEIKEENKRLADRYKMDEQEFLNAFGGIEMIEYDLKMRRAIEVLKK